MTWILYLHIVCGIWAWFQIKDSPEAKEQAQTFVSQQNIETTEDAEFALMIFSIVLCVLVVSLGVISASYVIRNEGD